MSERTCSADADIQRLWRFIERQPSGCWEWTGWRHQGYGYCDYKGKNSRAHRVIYALLVEPTPLQLDHLCRNRACVNPAHLEPVTARENVLRSGNAAAVNARKTHCAHGHPYDEENTRITPDGARACRACGRERARRKYRESKA